MADETQVRQHVNKHTDDKYNGLLRGLNRGWFLKLKSSEDKG